MDAAKKRRVSVRPIFAYMETDHKRCNTLFAQLVARIEAREWEPAEATLKRLGQALATHLAREEDVLFPAFELATGSRTGPTKVMRLEHKYVRAIVSRLNNAVEQHDANDFFGHADILRIMLEQHHLKEETILYVMIDRILSGQQGEIIDAMDAVDAINALNIINSIE
ncbi:MAG TPA: hemerythrin HHE cation-binding protein [Oxalobacteraceae bacterium]|jgi:iron-sulfur cluster repair protein YtfE (RIC family)|nr:hemerythrin HHE cation-binding protein [Oxalobacteraceae bacterium]